MRPAQFDQHAARVLGVEELDGRGVDPLDQRHLDARRNRVIPIQKSSRTSISACSRRPSHWRIACTSSELGIIDVVVQPLLELIKDDQDLRVLELRDSLAQQGGRLGQAAVAGGPGTSA